MRVAREIGTYKKEHDMTILQTGRYKRNPREARLAGRPLRHGHRVREENSRALRDTEFAKKVFEAIHEESVRQQMEIINK